MCRSSRPRQVSDVAASFSGRRWSCLVLGRTHTMAVPTDQCKIKRFFIGLAYLHTHKQTNKHTYKYTIPHTSSHYCVLLLVVLVCKTCVYFCLVCHFRFLLSCMTNELWNTLHRPFLVVIQQFLYLYYDCVSSHSK